MWWSNLFADMSPASFFNFSFLPKYAVFFRQGIEYTLLLVVCSVALAVIPALVLALMRLSKSRLVRGLSGAYIAVFRSTPLLVQLSIIYFGLFGMIHIPRYSLFGFVDLSRFIPGVVALALNSSAYVAEIFRAGILAVDAGQMEAARSLGLSKWDGMQLVVRPQAIKNVLPAIANEIVTMVKESSICSVLGMAELMFGAKAVASSTYITLAPYTMAALNYYTGLYYINFAPFSFFDITLRETLIKTHKSLNDPNSEVGFYQQDRSLSLRVRPIREKEGKWWPSILLGANDFYSSHGISYYAAVYGVVTKTLSFERIGRFSVTAGYARRIKEGLLYDGPFGGASYSPVFAPMVRFMGEYDTRGVNVGVGAHLFRHLNLTCFTREFKGISATVSYQYTIRFKR